MKEGRRTGLLLISLAAGLLLSGCVQSQGRTVRSDVTTAAGYGDVRPSEQAGTAEYVWEEPMVDVVDVPPGLDPDGIYYRPAHREVLEIRQGHWQYYRPDDTGNR